MNGQLFEPDFSGVKMKEPRVCQTRAIELLRQGYRNGHHQQILVMPTGSGKTITAMMLIYEALKKGKRATFVCDRTALINQTSAVADGLGLTCHAIVQANHPRRDNSMPLQIASIQTIQARGYWPESDLVVLDEAHTVYAAAVELLERKTVPVLGLTATPCTAGLGKLYSNVVNAATMDELTREEILVPLRILTCVTPDMAGAKTSGGEWTAKAAAERELTIVGDVVAEWVKHGEGRKTIAFGADIAYCEELVRRFNEIGINAACYTSETPDDERLELVREFSKPDSIIRILVSVSALAKGFDVKDVGCIIDARPLRKSLSEVIQMWGRGLRSSPETGKYDCILLDHSGNALRFHDDFVDVYYNGFGELSSAEKMDGKPRQEPEDWEPAGCPQCKRKPFRKRCLACGFEKPTQTLIDATPGQMQEIMIGKKKAAANEADMWAQLCTYARINLNSEKKAGWCWHKYQEIVGKKPPRSFQFDTAPDVPVSPALIGKLKSMRIAYIKGRKAA
jgi:superfamily II DNA or RNA helicase